MATAMSSLEYVCRMWGGSDAFEEIEEAMECLHEKYMDE